MCAGSDGGIMKIEKMVNGRGGWRPRPGELH